MKNIIDSINTAFRTNEIHNVINETLSDIQLMFNICEKVDSLFPDDETDFLETFVGYLQNRVYTHRDIIEAYVKQKTSEVSDPQTK